MTSAYVNDSILVVVSTPDLCERVCMVCVCMFMCVGGGLSEFVRAA